MHTAVWRCAGKGRGLFQLSYLQRGGALGDETRLLRGLLIAFALLLRLFESTFRRGLPLQPAERSSIWHRTMLHQHL